MKTFINPSNNRVVANAKHISQAKMLDMLSASIYGAGKKLKNNWIVDAIELDGSMAVCTDNTATVITALNCNVFNRKYIVQTITDERVVIMCNFDIDDSRIAIRVMDGCLTVKQMREVAKALGNYTLSDHLKLVYQKGDKIPEGMYLGYTYSNCLSTFDGAGVEYSGIATRDTGTFTSNVYRLDYGDLPIDLDGNRLGTREQLSEFFGIEFDKKYKTFGCPNA